MQRDPPSPSGLTSKPALDSQAIACNGSPGPSSPHCDGPSSSSALSKRRPPLPGLCSLPRLSCQAPISPMGMELSRPSPEVVIPLQPMQCDLRFGRCLGGDGRPHLSRNFWPFPSFLAVFDPPPQNKIRGAVGQLRIVFFMVMPSCISCNLWGPGVQ